MKFLVTGASGFVGSYFCKRLVEDGHSVVGWVKNRGSYSNLDYYRIKDKIDLVEGDLSDFSCVSFNLSGYEFDMVLHFGAQAIVKKAQENPFYTLKTNIMSTTNLLEYVRLCNKDLKCFVQMSTDKVYGNKAFAVEDSVYEVTDPYSASKIAAEQVCFTYRDVYHVPLLMIRACNIYGAGDYNKRVIPNTIKSLLETNSAVLFEGDDKMYREYIYIEDLYSAMIYLLRNISHFDSNQTGVFNIAPTERKCIVSTRDIVQCLCDIHYVQTGCEVSIVKKPGKTFVEIQKQGLVTDKIRELGWKSQNTLEQGLLLTYKWYKEHQDFFDMVKKR
ncbi:MAG TPA: NAD(P)-dependent oxidoreductase [Methanofastidiosum sp.]|nr:NAD(P)-dependent oxidoreductase [Methanofastidiosum sp.]